MRPSKCARITSLKVHFKRQNGRLLSTRYALFDDRLSKRGSPWEERHRAGHGGNGGRGRNRCAGEIQAAVVTVSQARTMRLAGASRLVTAGGDQIHANTV